MMNEPRPQRSGYTRYPAVLGLNQQPLYQQCTPYIGASLQAKLQPTERKRCFNKGCRAAGSQVAELWGGLMGLPVLFATSTKDYSNLYSDRTHCGTQCLTWQGSMSGYKERAVRIWKNRNWPATQQVSLKKNNNLSLSNNQTHISILINVFLGVCKQVRRMAPLK